MGGIFDTIAQTAMNIGMAVVSNDWAESRESTARRENFEYNERAAQAADARTRSLYRDLMSPSALLSQYKKAGLSPSLMFAGGGASGASLPNGAQGSGASGISPHTFGIDPFNVAQTRLMNAEANKSQAEADRLNGTSKRGQLEESQLEAQYENTKAETTFTQYKTRAQEISNKIAEATAENEIELTELEVLKYKQDILQLMHENEILVHQKKITQAQADQATDYFKNQIALQSAEILLKSAQTNLSKEQVREILYNMNLNTDKYHLDEKELEEKVKQWKEENKNKDQDQMIEVADMILNLIQKRKERKEKNNDNKESGLISLLSILFTLFAK